MTAKLLCHSIYHLNLAFSSIEQDRHADVVEKCYWPILHMAEKFPIGIEATAYTLECVEAVDPSWISKLASLLQQDQVELIASGDSQVVAPLVPAELTRWNLKLGMQAYQCMLAYQPQLAFLNEQAYSRGVVDLYHQAGFKALVMEWDNPFTHNRQWQKQWRYYPQLAQGCGSEVPLIWNHSIAFQKFQRYAHGEIILEDFLAYLLSHIADDKQVRAFPLYGNDAEIFNFRPGRFETEVVIEHNEWQRIIKMYQTLAEHDELELVLPSAVLNLLDQTQANQLLNLAAADMPVPVKKQRKYNLSRWAITGRDDLGLNTLCHQQFNKLMQVGGSEQNWQQLCRWWGSDFRTHITEPRWQALQQRLPVMQLESTGAFGGLIASASQADNLTNGFHHDQARKKLLIELPQLKIKLNLQKGMSIDSLAFAKQQFDPVVGTLAHGQFDSIELGADFFTSMSLIEMPQEFQRITDLQKNSWQLFEDTEWWTLSTSFYTPLGLLKKHTRIHRSKQRVELQVDASELSKQIGSYRIQHITFKQPVVDDGADLPFQYACHNGGDCLESFQLTNTNCLHSKAVSAMITSSTGLGATKGQIIAGFGSKLLKLIWDPAQCAVFPMVHHACYAQERLARLIFSMGEVDETTKAGGWLGCFALQLEPNTDSKI